MIKKMYGHCQVATIEEAGHWVHAEKTEEFIKVLSDFLDVSL
ncbi:MAG: alpha/beta hydrolase [Bacteroidales bacterium]|nr:alpha/beta hydrolase [Bacteroidales bacterium]